MSLKELCKALGWHRIRRWKHFVQEVKAIESNYETQKFLREKREAQSSISPYFDKLFGDWRPNPELVQEVMDSMESRDIDEVIKAVLRTPMAYSRYGNMQGWVPVDHRIRLTTEEQAQKIIADTPVETLQWIAEEQDCDDISEIFEAICRIFYGVNVRIVASFSSRHAFIAWPLLINEQVEWKFLEPQTDGWKTDLHIGDGTGKRGDVSQALIV